MTVLAVGLAIDQLRRRRSDLRGGVRLAVATIVTTFCATVAVCNVELFQSLFADLAGAEGAASRALLWGGQVFVFYLGVEPFVRRIRPTTMIGWSRLLQGRWNDALVARDVLIGLTVGAGIAVLLLAERALRMTGDEPVAPFASSIFGMESLGGLRPDGRLSARMRSVRHELHHRLSGAARPRADSLAA